MRAMQVHLSCSVAGCDGHFGQAAVPLDDSSDAWNSKLAIQLYDGCNIHAVTSMGTLTTVLYSPPAVMARSETVPQLAYFQLV